MDGRTKARRVFGDCGRSRSFIGRRSRVLVITLLLVSLLQAFKSRRTPSLSAQSASFYFLDAQKVRPRVAMLVHTHSDSSDVWPLVFERLRKYAYGTSTAWEIKHFLCVNQGREHAFLLKTWSFLRPVFYKDDETNYFQKVISCLDTIASTEDPPEYILHSMEDFALVGAVKWGFVLEATRMLTLYPQMNHFRFLHIEPTCDGTEWIENKCLVGHMDVSVDTTLSISPMIATISELRRLHEIGLSSGSSGAGSFEVWYNSKGKAKFQLPFMQGFWDAEFSPHAVCIPSLHGECAVSRYAYPAVHSLIATGAWHTDLFPSIICPYLEEFNISTSDSCNCCGAESECGSVARKRSSIRPTAVVPLEDLIFTNGCSTWSELGRPEGWLDHSTFKTPTMDFGLIRILEKCPTNMMDWTSPNFRLGDCEGCPRGPLVKTCDNIEALDYVTCDARVFDGGRNLIDVFGDAEPPFKGSLWVWSVINGRVPTFAHDFIDITIFHNFFHSQKRGFYVEVGAVNGVQTSASAFFDLCQGWNGLLVEASPCGAELLKVNRPEAQIEIAIVEEKSAGTIPVDAYSPFCFAMNTNANASLLRHRKSLSDILSEHNVMYIDYLSIDIEQFSLGALRGLDLEKVQLGVLAVEIAGGYHKWEPSLNSGYLKQIEERGFNCVELKRIDTELICWNTDYLQKHWRTL